MGTAFLDLRLLIIFRSTMATGEEVCKNKILPKPLIINGRFKNSWGNPGRPGNWDVFKFITVSKNESSVPSQKVAKISCYANLNRS